MGYHLSEEELEETKKLIDLDYLLEQAYAHGNNYDLGEKTRTHFIKCMKEVIDNRK